MKINISKNINQSSKDNILMAFYKLMPATLGTYLRRNLSELALRVALLLSF